MKILIIDNASVAHKHGNHYTNALNGIFIDELISLDNLIVYFQFEANSSNNISSYNIEEHKVKVIAIKSKKNKIINYLSAYWKALNVIKNVDFVYFYYPNSFKYLTFICKFLNKPYGLYIRGMKGVNDRISHIIYKNANVIFTVSEYFTNMVNEICDIKKANTIRPMIPYTDTDIISNRIYKEKKLYKILFLGRIAKDKGLIELIQAVKILKDNRYNFELHIVGDGEFLPQLRQLIFELNLNSLVTLDGPVYDNILKGNIYKNSDLYILPTYHEGFPRTLYESMIFGTPILTTFVGGIPALMIDGKNCIKIEPYSINSIVEKLSYAMLHYNDMGNLARNATVLVSNIVNKNRLTHARHLDQIIKGNKND